ncbi:MAG: SAM hydrolase/SAM-dependent halogenase family protein [Candidatus Dormibacteraceae bacterium]
MSRPPVTLSSDFGSGSPYVAAMKGVVLAQCPEASLVDVSHTIPPFDIRAATFMVWAGTRHFSPGAIHLAVIDPGVGTARRAVALSVGRSFYVGPDNGVFDLVLEGREPDVAVVLPRPVTASATFEGRDVFAPAAGALAAGRAIEEMGEPVRELVHLPAAGPAVVWVDGFGNLVTNVRSAPRGLRINGRAVTAVVGTYGEVAPGDLISYLGSMGYVEVGARQARAADTLGARPGDPVEVL